MCVCIYIYIYICTHIHNDNIYATKSQAVGGDDVYKARLLCIM